MSITPLKVILNVSMPYTTGCKVRNGLDNGSGMDFLEKTIIRPVDGTCTTNVLGSTVKFSLQDDQTIVEEVYCDVVQNGHVDVQQCNTAAKRSCDGNPIYKMSLKRGCNDFDWGSMHVDMLEKF